MYVSPNCKSKKQLKELIAAGQTVRVFSPGEYPAKRNGVTDVEGPHSPAAHTWYASVKVENGVVVRVIA